MPYTALNPEPSTPQTIHTPGCHVVVEHELPVVDAVAADLVPHVLYGHALTGRHVMVADPAQAAGVAKHAVVLIDEAAPAGRTPSFASSWLRCVSSSQLDGRRAAGQQVARVCDLPWPSTDAASLRGLPPGRCPPSRSLLQPSAWAACGTQ